MERLNITGKDLCNKIGVSYNAQILRELREKALVNFFKIGKKYMYPSEDAIKISNKLRKGEISIKVNNGYYITFNEIN